MRVMQYMTFHVIGKKLDNTYNKILRKYIKNLKYLGRIYY